MQEPFGDDFYEQRGTVSLGLLRLWLHACANEMGVQLSFSEGEQFAIILAGLIDDGRIVPKFGSAKV